MGWLSGLFDPGGIVTGESNFQPLLDTLNPGGALLDKAGVMPDWYSNASQDVADWANNVADFEGSNFSDMYKKFKNDPTQLLIGAGDPFSSKVWSGITGKEYTPYVNQYGGATEQAFQNAEKKGIDTSDARGAHQAAQAIASYYGGAGLGSAFGGTAFTGLGLGGASGQALGGALVGAGNAWTNDQNVWQGALTGGLGGYAGNADYGGYLGLENPFLKGVFNGAVSGAATPALTGGNSEQIGQGALYGGVKGGASNIGGVGSLFSGDEPPDVGSIGGNMQDEYGENSVTMPGTTSPVQADANNQRMQALSANYGANSTPTSSVDNFIAAITGGGSTGTGGGSRNYGGLTDLAGQALGFYDANRTRRRAKEQANQLQNLYGPNSAYAQNMRQRLERQDAAAGRRSQYGARETELAAKLADVNARMAPTLQGLYNEENSARNRMLSNGLRLGNGLYNTGSNLYKNLYGE